MTTSPADLNSALVREVRVTAELLFVDLRDGRSLSVPLSWYPRLDAGTPAEQSRWRLTGGGHGIHWPGLDEDLSVVGMLEERRSGESEESFRRWREARGK